MEELKELLDKEGIIYEWRAFNNHVLNSTAKIKVDDNTLINAIDTNNIINITVERKDKDNNLRFDSTDFSNYKQAYDQIINIFKNA